ncbi:MAG: hypothetical protein IJ565_00935 [Bacilli bacterium]|nr:hypothetical protein [Bacilli bacterium]
MIKLPPIEKIPEAYTAIVDNRITLYDNYATVLSSNKEKEYLIKWENNLYYSNDNSTYWQGYPGYPVIAVLMLQNKLSYNKEIASFFKNINWNKLNKDNKRDYKKSLDDILSNIDNKKEIYDEIDKVFEELKNINIELTRKRI